jgi:hypothetical protein
VLERLAGDADVTVGGGPADVLHAVLEQEDLADDQDRGQECASPPGGGVSQESAQRVAGSHGRVGGPRRERAL